MRRRLISRPTRLCVTRLKHERNPTVFLVSQRAASVRYADRIVVLEDGKAVAVGIHEELMQNCSAYQVDLLFTIFRRRRFYMLKKQTVNEDKIQKSKVQAEQSKPQSKDRKMSREKY